MARTINMIAEDVWSTLTPRKLVHWTFAGCLSLLMLMSTIATIAFLGRIMFRAAGVSP